MATNPVRVHPKAASDIYERRTDSTEAMSIKNAMLGVIDPGIMEVGVYCSVAARTRTISTCGDTAILRIIFLVHPR
jgi:hypothetical protein